MRTLVMLALLALAPAANAALPVDTAGGCVNYLYVADYHWYYVCVDPKGGTCAVYFKEQHGVTVTKECVVDAGATFAPPRCVFVAQDLDYSHWLCVNPSDPACAVYTETRSGGYVWRNCYGVLGDDATPDAAASCIPTSGGLDYHSYLCTDPKNPRCAVYTLTSSDAGVRKTCFPGV